MVLVVIYRALETQMSWYPFPQVIVNGLGKGYHIKSSSLSMLAGLLPFLPSTTRQLSFSFLGVFHGLQFYLQSVSLWSAHELERLARSSWRMVPPWVTQKSDESNQIHTSPNPIGGHQTCYIRTLSTPSIVVSSAWLSPPLVSIPILSYCTSSL